MRKTARLLWLLRHGIRFSLFVGAAGFLVVALLFIYYFITLPSPQDLTSLQVAESTKIYDRTGETVLYDVHGEYRRTVVPLAELPEYMVHATVAAEDADFYRHFGIDIRGVLRAMWENVRGGRISQGGSTITQQFIKNAFLTSERTFTRKIKEAILAVELELRYSKEQIIEWYLNQVPYGSNAYGAEAAAQTFFGKHAADLTLAEAAYLAGLPQAPTYYSPYGNDPERADLRKQYVLRRMEELGYITAEERGAALEETIEPIARTSSILAPHFVFHVLEGLEETYGKDYLQSAGLQITTSLDWELQEYAQARALERAVFNAKNYNGENVAAVVLDPHTGEILAMVGSRDYFDEEIDGNVNVATRPRQPGSSFKPFAYAKAFEKGLTPDTVVFDVPTEFNPNCSPDGSEEKDRYGLGCYSPQNYTETFRGPLTLKEALAQSINVPSVKTLYLAGIEETLELARSMGIRTLQDPSRYGLSLVLGGGEVTLLEEASAYGVFATGGSYTPPQSILSIKDADGKTIFEYEPSAREVLEKKIAQYITGILSSNELRTPVFGAASWLYTPTIASAVKTGTTQKYRDAWAVGYTNDAVVGVWAGNNDGTFMVKAPGSAAAGPLWNDIMTHIYTKKSSSPFSLNAPLLTGTAYLDGSVAGLRDSAGYHSLLYFLDRDNPQVSMWEAGIRNWLSGGSSTLPEPEAEQKENEKLITTLSGNEAIAITLLSPAILQKESRTMLEVSLASQRPMRSISISLDSQILHTSTFDRDSFTFSQSVAVPILPAYIKNALPTLRVEASDFTGENKVSQFPLTVLP